MQCKKENLPACLKLISGIILLVGLVSALLIYLTAGNYTSAGFGLRTRERIGLSDEP